MEQIQTIVAGGSTLLRAGIATALTGDPRLKFVAHMPDAREALSCAQRLSCHVLVLAAEVPHAEAAPVMDGLSKDGSRAVLLVLTANDSPEALLATLRLGVRGYGIHWDMTLEDLCSGVVALVQSGSWVCSRARRYLMASALQTATPAASPPAKVHAPLSIREVDVLLLAARGAGQDHIASTLCLSKNTVKTYLRRIYRKLEATSRAEAATLAFQRGLIPDRRVSTPTTEI